VSFQGDTIFSRSAEENVIAVWRILGFSSRDPPRADWEAPTPDENNSARTVSAYGAGYEREMNLSTPDCSSFYIHFSIFDKPGLHPVLAMGNLGSTSALSKIYVWDFQRFQHLLADEKAPFPWTKWSRRAPKTSGKPRFSDTNLVHTKSSSSHDATEASPHTVDNSDHDNNVTDSASSSTSKKRELDLSDHLDGHQAHVALTIPKVYAAWRGVDWSVGGNILVAVGERGTVGIFRRWEGGIPYSIHGEGEQTLPFRSN
jgi:polycomb protein EED